MKNYKLEEVLEKVADSFLGSLTGNNLEVVSHFDTDGITSAAIMTRALKRLDKKFSLRIVKSLNKEIIESLDKKKVVLFMDLASGSLKEIKKSGIKKVFIIDHHEIDSENIPENVEIINPELTKKEKISSAGLTYLFCKKIDERNKDSAKLAILGMVGDTLEKEIDRLNNSILDDGNILRKRGLLIYPSTRPLNRVLEFSSNPFIPGVTGNMEGVIDLLRESGIAPEKGKYKNLIDLTEEEMKNLVTSIVLKTPGKKDKDLIGDLFLVNFFGKLEDAREISAKINACSREGKPEIALGFCLENFNSKKKAESIHTKYRQELVLGIKRVNEQKKVVGKGYVIINTKDKVKDTMIGTISSILANSKTYENGTAIIGMSYDGQNKIKVSGRNVGKTGRNLREMLSNVMESFEGEVGGHHSAAGCMIGLEDEEEFIEKVKNQFELEVIKIANLSSN
ncbi:MAG: DHH family phosphoesterase [Nanoarchaeota archaeon]|nr:DHH family phosphoesterase [Nanoarchaeota archaeon]